MNIQQKIGVISDFSKKQARDFKQLLLEDKNIIDLNTTPEKINEVKTIVVAGGDGFFLHTIHQFLRFDVNFYGINFGSVGFLLNNQPQDVTKLLHDISTSTETKLRLLKCEVETETETKIVYAMNEATLFRETGQLAKIKIYIDDVLRLNELSADGVILSTAAGSTAYNFSLHGPIFPPEANILSLCPISPFRPRHFRGAILLNNVKVRFEVLERDKRSVLATADFHHFNKVKSLTVSLSKKRCVNILFNHERQMKEKILDEQFLI